MKAAFVTRVKGEDIRKLFPWAKKVIPVLGAFVVLDTEKASDVQKELLSITKKHVDATKKREAEQRRFAARMRRRFDMCEAPIFRGEPIRKKRKGK